jgi:hypothetical protein
MEVMVSEVTNQKVLAVFLMERDWHWNHKLTGLWDQMKSLGSHLSASRSRGWFGDLEQMTRIGSHVQGGVGDKAAGIV